MADDIFTAYEVEDTSESMCHGGQILPTVVTETAHPRASVPSNVERITAIR